MWEKQTYQTVNNTLNNIYNVRKRTHMTQNTYFKQLKLTTCNFHKQDISMKSVEWTQSVIINSLTQLK